MSNQPSKNPQSTGKTKGEGLSKHFIQKMLDEMQAIQVSKLSSS